MMNVYCRPMHNHWPSTGKQVSKKKDYVYCQNIQYVDTTEVERMTTEEMRRQTFPAKQTANSDMFFGLLRACLKVATRLRAVTFKFLGLC